jgi:hypothetical protein
MAPNDSPFIVKCSDELPARQIKKVWIVYSNIQKQKAKDSQVDTGQKVPELFKSHCSRKRTGSFGRFMTRNKAVKPYARPISAVTTGLRKLTIPAGNQ